MLINTLRLRQNGRHFPDDIFKRIFLNENVWISLRISLKFVPNGPINNIPALVQIMAWRRPGDKPLSESMMVSFPPHICVTRPQWVNNAVHFKIEQCVDKYLRFYIKMPSYQYRKSHCGDKTVVRSSYRHNRISYTGKTASLFWIRPQSAFPSSQKWWHKNLFNI